MNSYIWLLDTGLRLALGAFHTSPVQSLCIGANKPSQNKRRIKLAIQYVIKLKTKALNHACNSIFETKQIHLLDQAKFHLASESPNETCLETLSMDWDVLVDTKVSEHLWLFEEVNSYPLTHRTEEVWDTSTGILKTAYI